MSSIAWLRRQAVGWALERSAGLAEAMARMEFVQADPIRAPAPAQDLILRHRVPRYRVGDLDRRYPSLTLDEDVLYAYGFIARRLRPLLHPRPRPDGPYVPAGLAADVLAFVREHGVTHPRTVQAHFGRQSVVNAWGGRSAATTDALETLHRHGLLRVARRESGVRLYEAASPPAEELEIPERLRGLALRIAATLAPVPETTLRATLPAALSRAGGGRRAVVDRLLASGELAATDVDRVRYVWPADLAPVPGDPPGRVRFLAPFDPLVWDRRRFEHLWGWAYRFEAYTPVAKRKLGYYAMPLLWRDQVIGWANHTAGGAVDVGFVDGVPRPRRFGAALDAEITRLTTFLTAR